MFEFKNFESLRAYSLRIKTNVVVLIIGYIPCIYVTFEASLRPRDDFISIREARLKCKRVTKYVNNKRYKTGSGLFRSCCEFAEVNALSFFSVSHQNGKS